MGRVAEVGVLGITRAKEQLELARERAAALGLSDRVKFQLMDYRDLEGSFDRIVSVGMFEHVGQPHFRTYFRKIRALLADDGIAVVHHMARLGGAGPAGQVLAQKIL